MIHSRSDQGSSLATRSLLHISDLVVEQWPASWSQGSCVSLTGCKAFRMAKWVEAGKLFLTISQAQTRVTKYDISLADTFSLTCLQ